MPSLLTSTRFLVAAAVIVLVLLIAFVASRYHVAGANLAWDRMMAFLGKM